MGNLEFVVYQTRDGIEPFAIAAFLQQYEAQEYLENLLRYAGSYQFFIATPTSKES